MTAFTVYPAIDVREGRVVRLRQGDYKQETRYPGQPFELAQRYEQTGANWLHLVDLDAARAGGYTLAPLLRQLKRETGLQVQTGGGVRSADDVSAILDAGADRVVIGSLAVREPETVIGWLVKFGAERITVALDTRLGDDGEWQLPVSGWTQSTGVSLQPALMRYQEAGLRHLLCTDIDRDGMLSGPNLELYLAISHSVPKLALQASGGMRNVIDVIAALEAGCAGAVLGKALLDGEFSLSDAVTVAAMGAAPMDAGGVAC